MPLPWQSPYYASITSPRSLPGLQLWTDAADTSSLTTDTGIKLWADKSGNSSVNVLCLVNAIGNYGSAPDSVPLSITGPIDLRGDIEANSYATVGNQNIISKTQTDGQSAYDLYIGSGGSSLVFRYTPTGAFAALRTATSTATLGSVAAVFTRVQVRVTYDSASGDVIFYYRTDRNISASTGWTQLGATVTLTAGTIFDGTNVLTVGGWTGGNAGFSGLIYRAQIYNGIAGTLVFDANFATAAKLATSFTESSSNAATVTINTSGATGARISGARDLYQGTAANQSIYLPHSGTNYGYLNGVAGNYYSAPDAAPISITGPIDLRADCALADYTPSAAQYFIAKVLTDGQSAYDLALNTSGNLVFRYSPTGTFAALRTGTSTTTLPFSDTARGQIRATYDSATGIVQFFTRTDGDISSNTGWTQLGSNAVLTAGTIFDGTDGLRIGSTIATVATGNIYRAQIYDGIAGILAFDFNPAAYVSGTTFLDSSSNAATITINGGATVVTRSTLYFNGSAHYLKAAAFALSQPVSLYFVGSQISNTVSDSLIDGQAATSTLRLSQTGTGSEIVATAGSSIGPISPGLSTLSVVTAVFNGASSAIRNNRATATTGNAGAGVPNGIVLGAQTTPANYANITASEVLVYSTADSTAVQDAKILYLGRHNGIAV